MFPREFDYVAPATLEEALTVLGREADSKVIAGGMSLLPLMKLRLVSPALLVDIGRIPGLDRIDDWGGHLTLGPLVRHRSTATSALLQRHATALATAASWTGDVQVRNRGTTCGSVAHVDVAGDQPAATLALGATMVARSGSRTREVPAEAFFVDTLTSALDPTEILVELRIPKGTSGEGSAYDKLGRRGGRRDFAIAGAAAWVRMSEGSIVDARLALTGVSMRPVLSPAVTEAIVGTDGSPSAVRTAAQRAAEGITILEDLFGSVEYKTHLAKVYATRALGAAIEQALSSG